MDLDRISSRDLIKDIFNYIKDKNFKYKLFIHSKYFQKKLDINLIELKKKYLSKIKFHIDDYLHSFSDNTSLKSLYDDFLRNNKISREFLESIIYDIYQNKTIEENSDEKDEDGIEDFHVDYIGRAISIHSPLFGILSTTKNFEKIFVINMKPIKNIKDNSIKEAFENLNKSNKILSIYYTLDNIRDFDLKELNLKIKRLTLEITASNPLEKDINYLFETLFSIKNIENNLIYLKIIGANGVAKSSVFKKLNDFKLLKNLYIENLNISCNFDLYLNELNVLRLKNCNIFNRLNNSISKKLKVLQFYNSLTSINELNKVNFKDLKVLYIKRCSLSNLDALENANFDKLEKLDLSKNEKISNISIFEKLNLKKLKELNLYWNLISNIDVLAKVNFSNLEKLNLSKNNISNIDVLAKANFNKLKKLNLSENKISNIYVLGKVNFKLLEKLNLEDNNLSDINILEKADFKELKELN